MSYIIRLIKKAQKGNEKAFLKLFQMYEADIYRMAFVYLKNEEEALDIVQETAYKAFDKIESLKEPAYIKTWLIKITISNSLNRLKKLEKIVPMQNEYIDNIQFEQGDHTVKVLLQQILEELTSDEKGIVLLKYYEGYSITSFYLAQMLVNRHIFPSIQLPIIWKFLYVFDNIKDRYVFLASFTFVSKK